MNILHETRWAFREGILGASTTGRKIRRWLALGFLWLAALASWITGIVWVVSPDTSAISGVAMILNGFTFSLVSVSVIFTSSTSELYTTK